MAEEIVVGGLAYLKSGGPQLTVAEIDKTEGATVYWHNEAGYMQRMTVPLCVLVPVDEQDQPVDYKAAFFHAWRSRNWSEKDIELKWAEHERAMEQAKKTDDSAYIQCPATACEQWVPRPAPHTTTHCACGQRVEG